MHPKHSFTGFPQGTLDFLIDLAANNNRAWFEENRHCYDEFFLTPARDFVSALGLGLTRLAPGITADPRVDKSIFRLHRDIRFSKDKTPYKSHMGIWFWRGPAKRGLTPGFYFHLEPPLLRMGAGKYMFTQEMLAGYRQAAVDERRGAALKGAIDKVTASGRYDIGGRHYKRVPRGFDKNHPNAGLLKHRGLFASFETPIPKEISSPEIIDYCLEHYKSMLPVYNWLLKSMPWEHQSAPPT